MSKIYTKTGDRGQTSLFNGVRVPKNNIRVEAYGTVDELNSAIGVVIAEMSNVKYQISNVKEELVKIQKDLLEVGAVLANPNTQYPSPITYLDGRIKIFEKQIDAMTNELPPLTNFILPGGGKAGSFLHLSRAVSRRAERRIVELSQKEEIDGSILRYFNRLSDLLFTMSRFINYKEKVKEIIWEKR